ncbi:precorrin-2 C(20)-methyltransferase [Falsiporphyromonas endometrii]|uniref:Precorrin-2 C(20)-methyltransferase n=1 Tax=Falsiporphyromonas endometrii TaxID=1387297 RepID=A0ABV9K631_9PORP
MTAPIKFVSLGPGESELITLKGLRALDGADCIYCPQTRLSSGKTLSRANKVLSELGISEDKVVLFDLPMSFDRSEALLAYDRVREDAMLRFSHGDAVCIVAEGDIGIYSSVHYIYDRLKEDGYPVLHIPGIPSFVAANALAGLHLISGSERLEIIPGNPTIDELNRCLSDGYTAVIMKLSQCYDVICRFLSKHPDLDVHYFENVGSSNEIHLSTSEKILALDLFPYFSLMIIRPTSKKQ